MLPPPQRVWVAVHGRSSRASNIVSMLSQGDVVLLDDGSITREQVSLVVHDPAFDYDVVAGPCDRLLYV